MNYYLISPKVDGVSKEEFLDTMFEKHWVMMGWGKDVSIGKRFGEIQNGDCLIVAQRENYVFKHYFLGIADSPAKDYNGYQYIHVKDFVDLRNCGSSILQDYSFRNMRSMRAMVQITKGANDNLINMINSILSNHGGNPAVDNYVQLLEDNKNIILSGAPGTGKTYLAKEIARRLISQESVSANTVLEDAINEYTSDFEKRKELEQIRKNFIKDFPASKLKSMSLQDYYNVPLSLDRSKSRLSQIRA